MPSPEAQQYYAAALKAGQKCYRPEAQQYYAAALKAGQKCYREAVLKGEYPYPQVLDEILDEHLAAGRVELGVLNIPMDQIVGTKVQGRRNAFAANFMPLLPMESEFGMNCRWSRNSA